MKRLFRTFNRDTICPQTITNVNTPIAPKKTQRQSRDGNRREFEIGGIDRRRMYFQVLRIQVVDSFLVIQSALEYQAR